MGQVIEVGAAQEAHMQWKGRGVTLKFRTYVSAVRMLQGLGTVQRVLLNVPCKEGVVFDPQG